MPNVAAAEGPIPHDTIPSPPPAVETAAYYRLEVRGRWPGLPWEPAIVGPLNLTPDDDETASTFATVHEAMAKLDAVVACAARPSTVRLVRSDGVAVLRVYLGGEGK